MTPKNPTTMFPKSLPFLLTAVLLSAVGNAVADEDGWGRYENPRFGFVLPVPPGMKAEPPPTNGDGRAFVSADGTVALVAFAGFNLDGDSDVKVRWKEELAVEGRTITYKKKEANWFVVSGIESDGSHFYLRHAADAKYAATWLIRYPASREAEVSAWIERIADGYEARLGKGDDTIE